MGPKSFAELVGRDHVVKALNLMPWMLSFLHHAYLLARAARVKHHTHFVPVNGSLNAKLACPRHWGVCATCQEIDAGRFFTRNRRGEQYRRG